MESRKFELLGNLTAMDRQVKELKSYVCSMFSVYPLSDRENKQQLELDKKYKSCRLIIERLSGELKKFDYQLLSVYQSKTKIFEEKQQSYQNRNKLYTPTTKKAESNKDKERILSNSANRRISSITPVDRSFKTAANGSVRKINEKPAFNKRQSILDMNATKNKLDLKKPAIFGADYNKEKPERKLTTNKNLLENSNRKLLNDTPIFQPNSNPISVRQPRASLYNSALLKPRSTNTVVNIETPPIFKIPAPILNNGLNESAHHEQNIFAATPSRIPVAKITNESLNCSIMNDRINLDQPINVNVNVNEAKRKDQFKIPKKSIFNLNLLKTPTRLSVVNTNVANNNIGGSNTSNIILHSNFGLNTNPTNIEETPRDVFTQHIGSFLPTPTGLNSIYKASAFNSTSKTNFSIFTPRPHLQKPKSPVLESMEFDDNNYRH